MPLKALLTMIVTLGAVWGGFVFVLFTALRKERGKTQE
jgi:hypothetical protein